MIQEDIDLSDIYLAVPTVTFCGKELIYAIVARSTVCHYTVALNISGRKLTEQATVLAEANTEAMR